MHCISQEIDPKGKVNMHCSRHALIGLLGHCPEAKTHFTVSNHDPIQQTTRGQSNFPLFEIVMLLHIHCTKVLVAKFYYNTYMSHFSYACKMWYPLNLVLESWEYLWSYLTFWVVILKETIHIISLGPISKKR